MSGVYIKGMEMPTEAEEAKLIVLFANGHAEEMTHKSFPLIPVPYHRRLIDADALASMYDPNEDFGKSVRDMIEDCPTIIPADKEDT